MTDARAELDRRPLDGSIEGGQQSRKAAVMRGSLLSVASVLGSLVLAIALVAVHVAFASQLALAQAGDSIVDLLAGSLLAWAVHASARPADAGHPEGHHRAEPIAALVVAVLAGVLAIEIFRSAITALAGGQEPELDLWLVAVFAAKALFKLVIALSAGRYSRSRPAMRALAVDARNDVLVGTIAVVGFALARANVHHVDSILAMGVALYIAWSGLRLASENVELLMGASAPKERVTELAELVRSVSGVRGIDSLVATYHAGTSLQVSVEITVSGELSLEAAHAIGHAVQARLLALDDVEHAHVHVGPARVGSGAP